MSKPTVSRCYIYLIKIRENLPWTSPKDLEQAPVEKADPGEGWGSKVRLNDAWPLSNAIIPFNRAVLFCSLDRSGDDELTERELGWVEG